MTNNSSPFKRFLLPILQRIRKFFIAPIIAEFKNEPQSSLEAKNSPRQAEQLILKLMYQEMLRNNNPLPSFEEVGFQVYCETDEDGILWFIFSLIGTTNKKIVDIGCGRLKGSNTANLIINQGWTALLIDGNENNIKTLQAFYKNAAETRNYPPKLINRLVSTENINSVISENGFTGEVDLLCIDIDSIDYWIWKSIGEISPRVVVVEYQCIWGSEIAVTVPNKSDFQAAYIGRYGVYSGASLAAFVKLAKEKSYRLVGCQRYGYNAFFVRNDLGQDILPEISPAECFKHPFTGWAKETFFSQIKEYEWVEV
jgi:hypothetical protein